MEAEKLAKLKQLSDPLVKWLNEEFHPHMMIVITPDSAELLTVELHVPITEYIKD